MEKDRKISIKLLLSILYLIIIFILFVSAFSIYKDEHKVINFNNVKTTEDYSYIKIDKLSSKFAYYSDEKIGMYFAKAKENTGTWHAYIVAISDKDIDKYKFLMEKDNVKEKKLYGYPILINDELKTIALNHINDFLPVENEVKITKDNFTNYLTNCYLDTTTKYNNPFSYSLLFVLLILLTVIFLMIYTIFDDNEIVKSINKRINKLKR